MSHKLPAKVERAVADVRARKLGLADEFERALRGAVSEVKTAIMCQAGCSHCCLYPIYVSVLEAIPTYRHLRNAGQWTPALRKKLKAHADMTLALAPEVWLLSLIACPLLDGGSCTVYLTRPLTCRVTYSTGDPLRCHPHKMDATPSIIPKARTLETLALEESKIFKALDAFLVSLPLSKALLTAEALCAGDLEFETLNAWIYKEYEARR